MTVKELVETIAREIGTDMTVQELMEDVAQREADLEQRRTLLLQEIAWQYRQACAQLAACRTEYTKTCNRLKELKMRKAELRQKISDNLRRV